MKDITAYKAELVASWVESMLFGIFSVLFCHAMSILTRKSCHGARDINWPLLLASVSIFIGAGGHLVVVLCRAIAAFIDDDNGGPALYYDILKAPLEISQASIQIVVSFLGDSMAVYRVFVVYNRSYVAITIPIVCLCATLVASIASVILIASSATKAVPLYAPKLEKWMSAFFALTFTTSVLSTCLIAVRLWYKGSRTEHYILERKKTYLTAQKIFIESAMLYSSVMMIYLITYLTKTNYNIIFGDMVCPTIGIAFSLITIRVHGTLHCAAKGTSGTSSSELISGSYKSEIDRTAN